MSLFQSTNPKEEHHKGILGAFSVDNIKWEPGDAKGAEILAHRFEYEDFPNGSVLTVAPSQMAVFTNHLAKGNSLDGDGGEAQVAVFVGPVTIRLETGDSRFAPFRNISHALTGGESAFHSTVYFINTTRRENLPWGTQEPMEVFSPVDKMAVHVRASGACGVHIEKEDMSIAAVQARKFIERKVGTRENYTQNDLLQDARIQILKYVPGLLGKAILERQISALQMMPYLEEFSTAIEEKLKDYFYEIGLNLDHFSFTDIHITENDLRIINEQNIAIMRQETEMKKVRMEAQAMAEKRALEGYTYQQEKAFDVMGAAAANEGTASNIMGMGMGLGMGAGVGGAFGAAMGNMAQTSMGSVNMSAPSQAPGAVNMQGGSACPQCGAANPAAAKFCFSCGYKFQPAGGVCPSCGKALVPGAKFCFECGAKIGPAICPACGKELVPGAKFCLECGNKIE